MAFAATDFSDFWADAVAVTLVRRTQPAGSLATQSASAATEVEEATLGLVRQFRLDKIDGTVIQPDDRKVLLDPSSLTVAPQGKDELEIGGVRFEVIGVRIFAPEGAALAYDCHVRGMG